jgi:CheY-like chemotaxis protein
MPPNQVMTALKTVLLVDGDLAQRDELASRLESLGFTVSQATTGGGGDGTPETSQTLIGLHRVERLHAGRA